MAQLQREGEGCNLHESPGELATPSASESLTRQSSRACRLIVLFSALLLSREAFPQTGIVAIGDSNAAGYGVARHQAFPARLEALLRSAGYDVQVWNAGVPGDTFASISARLDRYVPDAIQIVIVQGGYNDVLRRTDAIRS